MSDKLTRRDFVKRSAIAGGLAATPIILSSCSDVCLEGTTTPSRITTLMAG